MKNLYYILLSLFLLSACSGGEPKPPVDGKFYQGDDNGTGIQYTYKGGRKVGEMPMKEQRAHGTAKEYYDDGTLRLEVNFVEGKRQGLTTRYYETGEKYTETPYVDGKKDGTKLQYMKNGDITFKVPYKNDKAVPGIEERVEGKLIEQPKIEFAKQSNALQVKLSNGSKTATYALVNPDGTLQAVESRNGNASIAGAKKGITIRAYYTTAYKNEAATDATY